MATATLAIKSPALLQVCAEQISGARRRAGLPPLDDAALQAEIADWAELLEPIPEGRLREAFVYATRTRTVRAVLQPAEVLAAYHAIREEERAKAPARYKAPEGERCFYCQDTGWQTVAQRSESGQWNTAARRCACSAVPVQFRSYRPLGTPEYRRREHTEIWEPVE